MYDFSCFKASQQQMIVVWYHDKSYYSYDSCTTFYCYSRQIPWASRVMTSSSGINTALYTIWRVFCSNFKMLRWTSNYDRVSSDWSLELKMGEAEMRVLLITEELILSCFFISVQKYRSLLNSQFWPFPAAEKSNLLFFYCITCSPKILVFLFNFQNKMKI